jgi:hypothetical protein
MPTGYIPARKSPVENLKEIISMALPLKITPKLSSAAIRAQKKNTRDGEKRSAMAKMAKMSVPVIKPN